MLRRTGLWIAIGVIVTLILGAVAFVSFQAPLARYERPPAEMSPSPADTEVSEAPSSATTGTTEFCAEIGRRVSPQDCADFAELAGDAAEGVAAFNAPDPMERGEVHTLQLAISYAPPEEEAAEAVPPAPSTETIDGTPPVATDTPLARRARMATRLRELRAERLQIEQARTAAQGAERVELETRQATLDIEIDQLNVQMARTSAAQTPSETVDPLQGETVEFTPLVGRFMRAELVGNGFEITPLSPPSQEVLPDSVTTWNWRVVAIEGGRRSLTLRTVVEGCTAAGQCYPLRSTSRNYDVTVTVGLIGQARDLLTEAPTWLRLLAGVLTALAVLVGAWFGLRSAFRKARSEG